MANIYIPISCSDGRPTTVLLYISLLLNSLMLPIFCQAIMFFIWSYTFETGDIKIWWISVRIGLTWRRWNYGINIFHFDSDILDIRISKFNYMKQFINNCTKSDWNYLQSLEILDRTGNNKLNNQLKALATSIITYN